MNQQPSSDHHNHFVGNQQNLSLENNESIYPILYFENQKIPRVDGNETSSFNQAQYHPSLHSESDIYSEIMSYSSQTLLSNESQEWIFQHNNHNSNFNSLAPDNQAYSIQNHDPQFNHFQNLQQSPHLILFEDKLILREDILNIEKDILNGQREILNKEREILDKEREIFKKREELALLETKYNAY
ncbi:hypothetical protein G9A89_015302 [Geosiphon pyriformis]|nr:hypothetical protein G9A89_015302 [Geosiphon pyriformis]